MTSEIRTNSFKSRAGLSTVTMTDSGPMFSGITTFVDNSGFTFGVGGGTSIFTPATNVLTFGTNNTEKVRIDANGNANITGVTTSTNFKTGSSNLHSTGLTVGNNFLHSTGINVGTGATIHVPATNTLTLGTNSAERLRIASNGDIGLGTVPETDSFQPSLYFAGGNANIWGSGNANLYTAVNVRYTGGGGWKYNNDGLGSYTAQQSGTWEFRNAPSGTADNVATFTTRVQIDANGKVQIGGSSAVEVVNIRAMTNGNLCVRAIGSIASAPSGSGVGLDVLNDANNAVKDLALRGSTVIFKGASAETLRIDSSGRVGINRTPALASSKLEVGGADNYPLINVEASGATGGMGIGGGGLQLFYGTSEKLRINSSGQLIQRYSADPYNTRAATFQSPAGVNATYLSIVNTESNGQCGILFGDHAGQNVGNYDGYINYDHSNQSMTFLVNGGNERLRITNTGQLLLGETSAFDSNTAIQFRKDNSGNTSDFVFRNRANNGNSRVQIKLSTLNRAGNADVVAGIEKYQSGGMAFYNGENTNQYAQMSFFNHGWASLRLRNGNHSGYDVAHISGYWGTSNGLMIEQGGPQSGTFKAIRFTTSHYGGERGYIGVTLGGTSYNSSSDYRMKQDVVDLTGAIDRVKSFKPRRFKWKEDPTYTVDGFLAHEASTVVPESVVGEKDAVDSNGDPEYQVMDNSKLVPVLTAALKEAIAKIEEASAKIETLEQDNIALRARVTNLEGN